MTRPEFLNRLLAATNDHDVEGIVACFADEYVNNTPCHFETSSSWRRISSRPPRTEAGLVTTWAVSHSRERGHVPSVAAPAPESRWPRAGAVPHWYHRHMAMNLRLTDAESEALRAKADQEGRSMQEVARTAIAQYVSERPQRLREAVERVRDEDRELLERLAQ